MKFSWHLGLDVLSITVFESRDLEFNCKRYKPNTETAQIWMNKDNINVLKKSDHYSAEYGETLNIEVLMDKLNFSEWVKPSSSSVGNSSYGL